ncbi:MAG: hypothetical protein IOC33_17625 [Burkholderia sp.]|jgi:hypothetical protein|uniref:hypothetical protein n=1 Tax=Burkholderia TaxID=32008 RepID=UPI001905D911|nr:MULTISPECIES: hypothetical protein [Burkholderia]MCA3642394.1 hypothetical protein [Methylobacterium sp.]MBJ9920532.1 hypothetical protein [Burkholderia cenocepacia]MCA3788871.1 hypothetical protein [Burkholderia sp.]MCA3793042.1 hypothetical protein [Burkholderia sp.]MCA3806320.1 hypothetical protein [Burkholderia sp.]
MQVARKNVIAIALFLVLIISVFALRTPYEGCANYTQALNGGTREFGGEKYKIELCGTRRFLGDGDEIRLQVMGPAGDVLAERYFAVRTINDAAPRDLEYGDDNIFYYDQSKSSPLRFIAMPPSRMDWLTARVPLLQRLIAFFS